MSRTRSFDQLPHEIALNILSSGTLTWRDFHSLILMCRRTAVLAKPFLYENFSTSFHYDEDVPDLATVLASFLANLARWPAHRKLVKCIELDFDQDTLDLVKLTPGEYERVKGLMSDRGVEMPAYDERRQFEADVHWSHFVAILLGLCRDITCLVIHDERSYVDTLEELPQKFDHNFPELRHVQIVGNYNTTMTRWGEDELDFRGHAFWIEAPALQSLEVRGAGRFGDHCMWAEDDFCGETDIGNVEHGSLSITELLFSECMLPMGSMGDLAGACKALSVFSVSWSEGAHFFYLRFPDLTEGLARHKNSLEQLVIDVSEVTYCLDGRTIADVMAMPPPGLPLEQEDMFPVYEGIGALDDFVELRHLEISVCVLGPFQTVEDLIQRLPGSLESLSLLSPTQHGQPDIEELVKGLLSMGSAKLPRLQTVNDQSLAESSVTA